MSYNYLIFSPFQAIEQHAFPEAFYAKLLREAGHRVSYLGCDRFFRNFCIAHAAYGLHERSEPLQKEAVCKKCIQYRGETEKVFGPMAVLEKYFDSSILPSLQKLVSEITPEEITNFNYKGISVGRIAAYEFIIHQKIAEMEKLTSEQLEIYKIYLLDSLKALVAFESYFSQEKVDRILLYNSAYSINGVLREYARTKNIPLSFIHPSFNLKHRSDSMYFGWLNTVEFDRHTIGYFEKHNPNLNLDYTKYPIVLDHIREQLRARSVFTYSAERSNNHKKICESLGIGEQYKKVVLVSMSSFDESFASDYSIMKGNYLGNAVKIFPTQFDWIRSLIQYFKDKPHYKVVIRVHPREFPNKREGKVSPRLEQYLSLFAALPKNIVVDFPTLKNSIYDLFEIVDFHLMSQTTTGCESAGFGIPGMAYIYGIGNYPMRVINPVPKNAEEYFQKIDAALAGSSLHSIESVRKVFDWYLFLHTKAMVFHNTYAYWERMQSTSLGAKVIRKIRQIFHIPRYKIATYLKKSSISASEKSLYLAFAEGAAEIVDLREQLDPRYQQTEADFKKYVAGLLGIYYGTDLSSYQRFLLGEPREKFYVSGSGVEARLHLPIHAKFPHVLAQYLCS